MSKKNIVKQEKFNSFQHPVFLFSFLIIEHVHGQPRQYSEVWQQKDAFWHVIIRCLDVESMFVHWYASLCVDLVIIQLYTDSIFLLWSNSYVDETDISK